MSFLSATPDVQAATRKLFNRGRVWVDTGLILPLIAETMAVQEEQPFTSMFRQARLSGTTLNVTWGVMEEVERHLNRCRAYQRSRDWIGDVPYVYARYVFAGGNAGAFGSWLEKFMGHANPIQDLADYVVEEFGFTVGEKIDVTNVPASLANSLAEYWREVHERRRNVEGEAYNLNIDKLVRHDVENCCIVVAERLRDNIGSRTGQQSWWLTLDKAAANMPGLADAALRPIAGASLILSLDFLMRYISFGPNREKGLHEDRSSARVFAANLMEVIPQELVKVAIELRQASAGLSERIVRRRLRDALDLERAKIGPLHEAGIEGATEVLLSGY